MMTALLTIAVLVTMTLACVSDVRSLRIPNVHSVIVLGAFAVAFLASPEDFRQWWSHLAAFGLMFVLTYVMFAFGMLGAGDSKFGSVLALWVGLHGLMIYVFYMALMGGVIGVMSIVFRKKKPFANPTPGSWAAVAQEGRNSVPYGVAISFGALMAFLHTGFIHHQLDELLRIIH